MPAGRGEASAGGRRETMHRVNGTASFVVGERGRVVRGLSACGVDGRLTTGELGMVTCGRCLALARRSGKPPSGEGQAVAAEHGRAS